MDNGVTRREFITWASMAAAAHTYGHAGPFPQQRTLLLVDDYYVLYRSGTHRRLVPLRKYLDNPVLAARTKLWEGAIGWNTAYRDPQIGSYKLWYQAFSGKEAQERTKACVVCYAESADGVHWVRPSLNLFSYNGQRESNIVLIGNGGHSFNYGASVVVTPEDPDKARRYKMAYFDWSMRDGQEYPGLSVAFSHDGISWHKHPEAPLLRASYGEKGELPPFQNDKGRPWAVPLALSDAISAIYNPKLNLYEIYGKMWIDRPDGGMYWKHVMARTQSHDFVHWSRPQIVLAPDDDDPQWLEFHASPVFYYKDCYFALLQILHRDVGGGVIDIELATSRDGANWERPFRKDLYLKRSEGRGFDSGSIFLDAPPIYLEDETRFYYGGYSQGATGGDDYDLVSGIGLATMQRDRFAGIEPVDRVGQVTLKPLDLEGIRGCTLNADASGGAIRVEILDAEERRIRGFTQEEAVPLTEDGLALAPAWRIKRLSDLPPGRYVFRLHLENARVFALDLHS
jgi:hypothetical protein